MTAIDQINETIEAGIASTMTANEFIVLSLIKSIGTIIEEKAVFAGIPKIKIAAFEGGLTNEEVEEALISLSDQCKIALLVGNPSKTADKSLLLMLNDRVFTTVNEM